MCNVHPGMFIDDFKTKGEKATPNTIRTHWLLSVQEWNYTILVRASIVSILNSKAFFCFILRRAVRPDIYIYHRHHSSMSELKTLAKNMNFCIFELHNLNWSIKMDRKWIRYIFWFLKSLWIDKIVRFFTLHHMLDLFKMPISCTFEHTHSFILLCIWRTKSIIGRAIFNAYMLFQWNLSL